VEAENFVFNKIRMIGDGGREFACLQINFLIKQSHRQGLWAIGCPSVWETKTKTNQLF
jgi:hypothetical protein